MLPEAAAYWRVKRRRGKGGGAEVVLDPNDEESGPLFLDVTATKGDLLNQCGAGSYYLEAVDLQYLDIPGVLTCEAIAEGEPDTGEVKRAPTSIVRAPSDAIERTDAQRTELGVLADFCKSALDSVQKANADALQHQRELFEAMLGSRIGSSRSAPAATPAPAVSDAMSKIVAELEALKAQAQTNPAWAPAMPLLNNVVTSVMNMSTMIMASKMPGGIDALRAILPPNAGAPAPTAPMPSAAPDASGDAGTRMSIDLTSLAAEIRGLGIPADETTLDAMLARHMRPTAHANGVGKE